MIDFLVRRRTALSRWRPPVLLCRNDIAQPRCGKAGI